MIFILFYFILSRSRKAREIDIFICVGIKARSVEGRRRERMTGKVAVAPFSPHNTGRLYISFLIKYSSL